MTHPRPPNPAKGGRRSVSGPPGPGPSAQRNHVEWQVPQRVLAAQTQQRRRTRRRRMTIAIFVVIGLLIALLAVVLAEIGSSSRLVGANLGISTRPPTPPPSTQDNGPERPSAQSALATGPTDEVYRGDEQPAVYACVDTSLHQRGDIVLHRAQCADPHTPLILDNIQARRCTEHGYSSIRGSSGDVLCFTWNVRTGDCVDLYGPRKAPCSPTSTPSGRGGTITITEVKPGGRDGTGCPDPNRFLQAGAGPRDRVLHAHIDGLQHHAVTHPLTTNRT